MSQQLQNQGELKRSLNLPMLVAFGLAYLAPTVVFNYYGIWTAASGTGGHYPLALLITTLLMAITAYSYTRMVKEFPVAGSAYVYVNKSVQPHIGFMTGWIMLLDYLLLPMAGFLLIGIYVNLYFPVIPTWLAMVVVAAIAAFLNVIGAKMAALVDTVIIAAQILFTLLTIVLCIVYVCKGGGSGSLFTATAIYNPETFDFSSLINASAVLCLSFVGFDAVTTMAEETKNPEKVMTPAVMLTCVGAGALFFVTSYCMNLAWPEGVQLIQDPDTGVYEFYDAIHCGWAGDIFFVVDNCASFVCSFAAIGAGARILLGMGRDNVLPKQFFGSVSRKFNTPVKNIILTTVISCVGIFFADNLTAAMELVSFGVIIGFIMVNFSVFMLFFVRKRKRSGLKNIIMYVILPWAGVVVLAIAFIYVGTGAKILGCIWTALGIIYLAIKTKGFKELPPEMTLED